MNNEQLCALAQKGDTAAKQQLIENNLAFVHRIAYEVWSAQQELNASLNIETDDLIQEGSIGLLRCIDSYDPSSSIHFFPMQLRRFAMRCLMPSAGSMLLLKDVT